MANNSYVHQVQEDATIEILSKLPVKSLLRFKCVCKYWCNLVKNSYFIRKHLHRQNRKAYLLVERYNYGTHICSCALLPLEMISNMPIVYHDLEDPHTAKTTCVVDSFNGILCIWDQYQIALWNPTIREFKPLPVYNPILPPHIKVQSHHFGFGIDLVTNKYKLACIMYLWDEEYDFEYEPPVASVYTLGVDSWRPVEVDLPHHLMVGTLGNTCINGIYYWQITYDGHHYDVLSFDMKNEVFRIVLAPLDIDESQLGTLALYNEALAMVLFDPCEVEKQFDIRVMKEEGFWTKQLIIGPLVDVYNPLGCSKNGEFFFYSRTSQLVVYTPNTHEIKYLGPHINNNSLMGFLYEESLASVKVENVCLEGGNTLWSQLNCFLSSIHFS